MTKEPIVELSEDANRSEYQRVGDAYILELKLDTDKIRFPKTWDQMKSDLLQGGMFDTVIPVGRRVYILPKYGGSTPLRQVSAGQIEIALRKFSQENAGVVKEGFSKKLVGVPHTRD